MKNPKYLKAVTTGLAGAAALASGTEAYGAPVAATSLPANFTPANGVTNPLHSTLWDVDGDGTVDFGFGFYQKSTNGTFVSGIYGNGGVGYAAAVGYLGVYGAYANNLTVGSVIGPTSSFVQNAGYYTVLTSRFNNVNYGQFSPPNGTGFVGFEFTEADGIHYGYIQLTTARYTSSTNKGGQQFLQAFYETVPGVPIAIPAAVPEPGSLASLAFGAGLLGAVAVRARKRTAQV